MPGVCCHNGSRPVKVGRSEIFPGGAYHMHTSDYYGFDLLVPLDNGFGAWAPRGVQHQVVPAFIEDFQPPPSGFDRFLKDAVIPDLETGDRILVFCLGGHGRTGSVLAGLIALLEPDVEDPVSEIRNRYCPEAVETREQAEWVFALRGQDLPQHLQDMRSVPAQRAVRL